MSMLELLDFLMSDGKQSSELWLNTSHLGILTWRPSGGPNIIFIIDIIISLTFYQTIHIKMLAHCHIIISSIGLHEVSIM